MVSPRCRLARMVQRGDFIEVRTASRPSAKTGRMVFSSPSTRDCLAIRCPETVRGFPR
jgi:hypothetical protein